VDAADLPPTAACATAARRVATMRVIRSRMSVESTCFACRPVLTGSITSNGTVAGSSVHIGPIVVTVSSVGQIGPVGGSVGSGAHNASVADVASVGQPGSSTATG
jgi:hypothetical protein